MTFWSSGSSWGPVYDADTAAVAAAVAAAAAALTVALPWFWFDAGSAAAYSKIG